MALCPLTWNRLAALTASLLASPLAQALPTWTAAAADNHWSSGLNWSTGVPPTLADTPIFGSAGSGGSSLVNQDFSIGGITYNANSSHTTRIGPATTLQVAGPAWLGVGDPSSGSKVVWAGGGQAILGKAASPASLWVGVNNSNSTSGTTFGTLNLQDIAVGGFIGDMSIGRRGAANNGASNADGLLVLASNSSLSVGTSSARANISIGRNDQSGGAATGVFDARQGTLDIHANDFLVGSSAGNGASSSATGTLRWNSTSVLDANTIVFGNGTGTGYLDLASGDRLSLRTGTLGIGSNFSNATSGTGLAHLDMTVNNPSFSAVVTGELNIGRRGAANNGVSHADGLLVLASNSSLSVGTFSARANISIGRNDQSGGAATGVFDASQGSFDAHAATLNVGWTSGGSATGTFSTGERTSIDATQINVGSASSASAIFNLGAGTVQAQAITVRTGGSFNFTGGRLMVGTFTGNLFQQGGTLAPASSPGTATIEGDYALASAGSLEVQLNGTTPGTQFSQMVIHGLTDLNQDQGEGGVLDLHLGYAAKIGDSFLVLNNDGTDAIGGHFRGLEEGARLSQNFDGLSYTFEISYRGGTGNDVTLNAVRISPVPEPQSWALLLAGGLLVCARWRRQGCIST